MRRIVGGGETHAYSAAVVMDVGIAYLSGHGPLTDGQPILGSIEEQTTLTLENLLSTAREVGADKSRIVKCNCFLSDIEDFDQFDSAYRAFFGDDLPARTTVEARLYGGIAVEIEAIVETPGGGSTSTDPAGA